VTGNVAVVRRRMQPSDRRQAIIDATITVARRQGLAVTTARDIGTEMHTSSGLIHHYFDSMDEVLAAAFEHAAGADLVRTKAAVAEATGAVEQLDVFIGMYASAQGDWTMQLWLDAWAEAARRPALQRVSRRLNRQWQAMLRDIVQRGLDDDCFVNDDVNAAAWRILSVLDGLAMQVVAHDALISRADVLRWATVAANSELKPTRRRAPT
jgi:AcrR family transcriptional regulator